MQFRSVISRVLGRRERALAEPAAGGEEKSPADEDWVEIVFRQPESRYSLVSFAMYYASRRFAEAEAALMSGGNGPVTALSDPGIDLDRELISTHAFEIGLLMTAARAMDDLAVFRRLVRGTALILPPAEPFLEKFPAAEKFLQTSYEEGIPFDLWSHTESPDKLEIGYALDEVALTLAYAADESSTAFFVFCKPSPEARLPRSRVKEVLKGVKDLRAASDQALINLSGHMEAGSIGPFPGGPEDEIFVDSGTLERLGGRPVNFSAGVTDWSFNISLDDAVVVLEKLYPGRVHVRDLEIS